MTIPFIKAHGAGNDFLMTWAAAVPHGDRAAMAKALCSRHTGAGADGWYIVKRSEPDCDASIHLYNSDGSEAELSGNGTRCVAAVLVHEGHARETVRIRTGAGIRLLRLLGRSDREYRFEMAMGFMSTEDIQKNWELPLKGGALKVTTLDVGNPQCVVFVDEFPADWATVAAEIERHGHFPQRTNVSFVRVVDRHTLEARFFERGAGKTLSSGTGSMGASLAAIARGLADTPIAILTPEGPLTVRWEHEVYLTGPAVIVARGECYL